MSLIREVIQFILLAIIDDGSDNDYDDYTAIDMPETTSKIALDDESSTLLEQDWLIHNDTSESEQIRFGDSDSSEIQQYEDSLIHLRSEVDADRRLVNQEQAEVDHAGFRSDSLSDQISHGTDEMFVHGYQSQLSLVETELASHQQKLEQARADFTLHQQAEFDTEDKLREALSKED